MERQDLQYIFRKSERYLAALMALLIALALGLVFAGCWNVSAFTAEIRRMQTAAVLRCRADQAACPEARACATASVRASDAYRAWGRMIEADKAYAAGKGPSVNLMLLEAAKQEALTLRAEARAACGVDPADAGATSPPLAPPPDGGASDLAPRDAAEVSHGG